MATPPTCDFGLQAPDFALPGTDGKTHTLADISGENGTLVMFICNHCPYVVSVLDRIIADAQDLQKLGIGVAAISANDATAYPADSFDNMRKIALPFPYLYDETQATARAYAAACTPDFFGFNAKGQLQYRGRLDAASRAKRPADMRRDLYEAMAQIATTGQGPQDQVPSMGCSIKWK
jgi:peroxiredoxin